MEQRAQKQTWKTGPRDSRISLAFAYHFDKNKPLSQRAFVPGSVQNGAICRQCLSCSMQNQFGPESVSTDPALHMMQGTSHG